MGLFGRRSRDDWSAAELAGWVDDVDVGPPLDTGAEDEVRALMAQTPLPVATATDYEDTVPRALPPRAPRPRRGLGAVIFRRR
jgi:hypothetical protein